MGEVEEPVRDVVMPELVMEDIEDMEAEEEAEADDMLVDDTEDIDWLALALPLELRLLIDDDIGVATAAAACPPPTVLKLVHWDVGPAGWGAGVDGSS